MKISRWEHARHGPLSEAAVRTRFKEPHHRLFRRHVPQAAEMHGVAGPRVLVPLSGSFYLGAGDEEHLARPGEVLEVPAGAFTFSSNEPVTFMAIYRLHASEWAQ